ncbi:MAG: hypothetical protein IJ593_01740, partial [Lachnospiraceae bacterium]|nr:hypothetical protein [Lachnospiraceae bacterium]
GGIAVGNLPTTLPNGQPLTQAPTTTENALAKPAVTPTFEASLVAWVFDQVSNKFKLNVAQNGQNVPATNGFYTINEVTTTLVNNIAVPVAVQNTYYFDTTGSMVTGWVKTVDNKTYFFENAKTADEGKMAIGWKQIENSWYYFNADGSMLVSATTPDGYVVGADGKMM